CRRPLQEQTDGHTLARPGHAPAHRCPRGAGALKHADIMRRHGRQGWGLLVAGVLALAGGRQPLAQQPALPRLDGSRIVPVWLVSGSEGLEVTLWAAAPLQHNPTNIDIDRDGRIWVAEGVRYRQHHARRPEGDPI